MTDRFNTTNHGPMPVPLFRSPAPFQLLPIGYRCAGTRYFDDGFVFCADPRELDPKTKEHFARARRGDAVIDFERA